MLEDARDCFYIEGENAMIDSVVKARSEMSLIVTFGTRQYSITKIADYYTWFPNVMCDLQANQNEATE